MKPQHLREHYRLVRASDIVRDGVWLELYERASDGSPIMMAFYSDLDGTMVLQLDKELPFEVVEAFMAEARSTLPPTNRRASTGEIS